jgi:small-conductance mechanosensitive channel
MVSFLCLFSIAGAPWITAIFIFFWYIVVNIIEQFKAPRKISIKYLRPVPKSEQMDNQVNRYFYAVVRTPLGMFHSVGTTCFLFLFIYAVGIRKMHLASLFSMWGAFLWNIVMVEIQLYAKDKQKKTALLHGEDVF